MSFWKIIGGEDDADEEAKRKKAASSVDVKPVAEVQSKSVSSTVEPVSVGMPPPSAVQGNTAQRDPLEKFGKIRSALGPGTVIQGKLSFDTPVSIDGRLSGEVISTKAIVIGAGGVVDAVMNVASLVVQGKVKGKITATESIELLTGAELEGEMQTPSLIVQEGAILRASCSMSSSKVKQLK